MSLKNRYDFVLLFDVKDGNPNGDPDAGNLPRLDAETGHGLVTDVSLKRKVRNYVALTKTYERPFDIYVKERAVLGRAHTEAFQTLGITLGEEVRMSVSASDAEALEQSGLPDGMSIEKDADDKAELVLSADLDKKAAQEWIKENKPSAASKKLLAKALKDSKGRKPTQEESDAGRGWLCKNFYDIRTFGAVLSLKSAPNCGQVRGPVQMTFARSVEPIVALEHSITRMAVATEAEAEKQEGGNRTMGRKHTVPYGIYRSHGFVSSFLAKQTGFGEADLKLLWDALQMMFEQDRSAARGQMATRGLYVFQHDSELGNAHAHDLFNRITVRRKAGVEVARDFSDYEVLVNENNMPQGVKLLKLYVPETLEVA
jgi:CRISPR-associated protein Csd2